MGLPVPRNNPETWLEEHGDFLLRYAYSRIRNQAVAEDLVQETLLAALRARDSLDHASNLRRWLLGILKHKIVDYFRKSSREVCVEDFGDWEIHNSLAFKSFGLPPHRTSSSGFNPRKAFEKKEFWEVFSKCISHLKGPIQRAFVLREMENVETIDCCKILNISANNLWVMLHRARTQVRSCLEKNW